MHRPNSLLCGTEYQPALLIIIIFLEYNAQINDRSFTNPRTTLNTVHKTVCPHTSLTLHTELERFFFFLRRNHIEEDLKVDLLYGRRKQLKLMKKEQLGAGRLVASACSGARFNELVRKRGCRNTSTACTFEPRTRTGKRGSAASSAARLLCVFEDGDRL